MRFLVFYKIDDVIEALKSEQVDGLLLDRYSTAYYQARNKLGSLVIVKKFEFSREVGILISKDRKNLTDCLNHHDLEILGLVEIITSKFEVNYITDMTVYKVKYNYICILKFDSLLCNSISDFSTKKANNR